MQKSSFLIPEWTVRLLLAVMMPMLNEFQRRMLLGTLCIALGHGSRKYLTEITETSERTITRGKDAIEKLGCHAHNPAAKHAAKDVARARKPGGGRKPIKQKISKS